jgi:hypothetical protein
VHLLPLTLDIGQIGTYLVPFRHCFLLLGIFKVDSGVHLDHLGATQPRKWGLKKATGSGSVQESSGAPKQAARRSRVVPRSKQLGRQSNKAMSSRAGSWASSQTRRCRAAKEMRGPPSGRAQEGRRQPPDEVNGLRGYVVASYGRSFRG